MFRTFAISIAFLSVTLALLLFQPSLDTPQDEGADVTRIAADLDASALPQPAPMIPALIEPARIVPAAPQGDDGLHAMTQGVLADLGVIPAATPAMPQDSASDALRDMTHSALSTIRAATGQSMAPATPAGALQGLIVQALREGQSDSYIDALLNEAAARGDIAVPGALITSDGRVDTHVLLGSIVAQASKAAGAQASPAFAANAAVPTAPASTMQDRIHTVAPGESLGALAVRFYGDITRYSLIFEANRNLLSSPDQVRVGQRLVIPAM